MAGKVTDRQKSFFEKYGVEEFPQTKTMASDLISFILQDNGTMPESSQSERIDHYIRATKEWKDKRVENRTDRRQGTVLYVFARDAHNIAGAKKYSRALEPHPFGVMIKWDDTGKSNFTTLGNVRKIEHATS